MDANLTRKRFERLFSDRTTAQEEWDLIRRFVYPIGGGKFWEDQRSEHSMNWREREVFDDTAITGCDTLASSIHSAMTPTSSRWFDAGFRADELKNDQEASDWLQRCMETVWNAIQESNFDLEVGETYLDLVAFGNAVLIEEESSSLEWKGVHFKSAPLKECYFELDHRGEVSRFYRLLTMTPHEMVTKFGKDTPDDIAERAEQADTTRVEVIFCIYPNDDAPKPDGRPTAPDKRPYEFHYLRRDGGEYIGKGGGYYEMPVFFPRWRRATGSIWGYGPSHLALPTVLTLDQLKYLILANAEKVIDPVTMVTERGVIGDVDLEAGGINVVKDVANSMAPYQSGARFDVSQLEVDKLQQSIRNLFRMNQLELQQGPQMTATEVEVRYELMHRLLGPTQGRIKTDLLDKVVERTFNILYRAGKLPPPPESVAAATDGAVDISYLGPLARAQKMDKVNNVNRWLGTIAEMSNFFPDIGKVPRAAQLAQYTAREMSIPADLVRTDEEVDYIKQLERQVEVMAQQMEEMQGAIQQGQNQQQAQ